MQLTKTKTVALSLILSAFLIGCDSSSSSDDAGTNDSSAETSSQSSEATNTSESDDASEASSSSEGSEDENENENEDNESTSSESSETTASSSSAPASIAVAGQVGASASNLITPALAKSANLSKGLTVFGINLLATSEVPNAKLLHAANIMAELLDNDEDGVVDNQAIIDSLVSQSAYETMYNLQEGNLVEIDNDIMMETTMAGTTLGAYETRTNYADGLNHDASIEEIFHLITQFGYSTVYPATFKESNNATSTLAQAMDVARGGRVTVMPEGGWSYPESAWYYYMDETADYATMMTEYIYWAVSSNFGMHDSEAGLQKTSSEWKPNTKAKLQAQDPTVYGLINDAQYKFPQVMPNADYTFYKFKESDIQTF